MYINTHTYVCQQPGGGGAVDGKGDGGDGEAVGADIAISPGPVIVEFMLREAQVEEVEGRDGLYLDIDKDVLVDIDKDRHLGET